MITCTASEGTNAHGLPAEADSNYQELPTYFSPEPVDTHQARVTENLGRTPWANITKSRRREPRRSPDKAETFLCRILWVFKADAWCLIASQLQPSREPCMTAQGERIHVTQHLLPGFNSAELL